MPSHTPHPTYTPANEFSTDTSLIQVTVTSAGIAHLKLNRPEKRNALSQSLIDSLIRAIAMVERDDKVRVVVFTGSRTAGPFSAGADLTELQHLSTPEAYRTQYLHDLSRAVTSMRKPTIASVAGFALGGGFELALMCDILLSSSTAKFGLPELTVGTIPGAGGTQRLTRALGKQKAMDLILTSSTIMGPELERFGLVSRCCELDELGKMTMSVAEAVAGKSMPVVGLAKMAILNAEETHLEAGLRLERSLYYSSFSLEDRTEGVRAFTEKRPPVFKDK